MSINRLFYFTACCGISFLLMTACNGNNNTPKQTPAPDSVADGDTVALTKEELLDKVVTEIPDGEEGTAYDYFHRGNMKASLGDDKGAIADYDRSLSLDSTNADTWFNRAIAHENLGNFQLAVDDYTKALELMPEDADAYYNRGITKFKMDDLQAAEADFDTALELDSIDPDKYYMRALARCKLGDTEAGCKDARTAEALGGNATDIIQKYCTTNKSS